MITAEETKRLARGQGLAAGVLEKDYALTWLLSGIYSEDSKFRNVLIFKGGTAIRKAYFPTWRLSEDLDFTIVEKVHAGKVKRWFEDVFGYLASTSGLTFSFGDYNASRWSILADVHYVGPLGAKNRIAHDITLTEQLVEEPVWKNVGKEYPDLDGFDVKVYSLTEVLVEKIRSIFQRGKSRDYYDVWRLLKEKEFDGNRIRKLLIKKCEINGIEYHPELVFDEKRLMEARNYWKPALGYLTKDLPDFDSTISELRGLLDIF